MASTSSGTSTNSNSKSKTKENAYSNSKSSPPPPPYQAKATNSPINGNTPLISLGDLLTAQLERFNYADYVYKDELQLLLQLATLDTLPPGQKQRLQKQATSPDTESCLLDAISPKSNSNSATGGAGFMKTLGSSVGIREDATTAAATMTTTAFVVGGLAPLSKSDSTDDDLIGAVGGEPLRVEAHCASSSGGGGGGKKANARTRKEPFRSQVLKWFQQLNELTAHFKSDEESRRAREAGNDSYRKERHSLKACDFFTEAIFLAPAKNSIAAAVAHANRSTVLYDCGMYAESYDDCLCALDLGYPEEYHTLIKLRQASCALKMRNFALCEEHLHQLLHMELNEVFEARTHELWHQCEVLKAERYEMGVQTGDDLASNDIKVYEVAWLDNSNTMTSNRSAQLRAVRHIPCAKAIFHEETSLLVPSGECRLCDHCGATQFVPFPCIYCSNRTAVYCSRECRTQHASIHAIECYAHQIELFERFTSEFRKPRLLQLAFRMLITGLPQVVVHCRKRPTLQKMWNAFNGVLTERQDIAYSAILRLEAHTDSANMETLAMLAIVAQILAIYLSNCTSFFEQLERAMPSPAKLTTTEWELLTAALLLRHICQLRHKNLIHCPSFVLPADPHVHSALNEFQLWAGPLRAYKGHLHLIAGDVATVAYAVYPHLLSLCRHSCASTIHIKYSERKMTAYAKSDIAAGATISNCFASGSGDYRQSAFVDRQDELKARGIDCKCEKCLRLLPDEDFQKFHRYRCDNPNCMQIFTPHNLKRTRNLRWWLSEYYKRHENNGAAESLICSHCNTTQKLEWYWNFNAALDGCDAIEERCKLYAAIERANTQLVELHELKAALARQLIEQCLLVHRVGATTLDDWEFNKLGSIMRSAMPIIIAQYGLYAIQYVQHFSYFWDVMALSNYKCSDRELMQMLNALEYIADEYKEIFINYYEEHIAPLFIDESTTYASIMDTEV